MEIHLRYFESQGLLFDCAFARTLDTPLIGSYWWLLNLGPGSAASWSTPSSELPLWVKLDKLGGCESRIFCILEALHGLWIPSYISLWLQSWHIFLPQPSQILQSIWCSREKCSLLPIPSPSTKTSVPYFVFKTLANSPCNVQAFLQHLNLWSICFYI